MTIAAILGGKGRDVVSVSPTQTVAEAIALLAERRIGAVPVMEGDAVAGIFSERDVIYCLRDGDTGALQKTVGEVMTAPAMTVTPQDAVIAALSLMTKRRVRHLPVVEDGRVIGLVSIGDLVNTASTGSRPMPRRCAITSSRFSAITVLKHAHSP